MANNFNKIDRAAAFNPIAAFPLDARFYFERLSDAISAAESARAAGNTTTQYYFGQPVVVVENKKIKYYVIQQKSADEADGGELIELVTQPALVQYVDEKIAALDLEAAVDYASLTQYVDSRLEELYTNIWTGDKY